MRLRNHFRQVCVGLATVLGILLGPNWGAAPAALAATSYVVNDNTGDCDTYVRTHTTIQAAVDDAIDNHVKTILVCPGAYDYFGMNGANKLTIKAALAGTFPKVNAPTDDIGTIVEIDDSSGVVLDGLTIDGTNFTNNLTTRVFGVVYLNSTGTIQNSVVTKVRCYPDSCDNGIGIMLYDNNADGKISTLNVKNTHVTDFEVSGIQAFGPTRLSVTGTQITGNFSGGAGSFGDGVAIYSSGASGKVSKNTISSVHTGVLVYGANKISVANNFINTADNGIYLTATCNPNLETSNSNKVSGNTLNDIAIYGVIIHSDDADCSHTDTNTISGNWISGSSGSIGGVIVDTVTGAFADKNKISGNTIFGFALDIFDDPDATNTSISKNILIP